MPLRLVSLDGHPDIPLDHVIVVGRDPRCDIRIGSFRVSKRHCRLAHDGDGVLVRDLGSTNGTRINGRRVDRGVLRPGDELSIAHCRFHLEDLSRS
jgi:pSer/pThr/pTyr-binding forkhead associated (FHA) protein